MLPMKAPMKPPIPMTAEVKDIMVLRNWGTCSRDRLAKAVMAMVPNNTDRHRKATEIDRSGTKTKAVPDTVVRIPAMAIEPLRPRQSISRPAIMPPMTDITAPTIMMAAPKVIGIAN